MQYHELTNELLYTLTNTNNYYVKWLAMVALYGNEYATLHTSPDMMQWVMDSSLDWVCEAAAQMLLMDFLNSQCGRDLDISL